MPRDNTQPQARFWMPNVPRDPSAPDVGSLRREIERLRVEREAMLVEDLDLMASKGLRDAKKNDSDLRKRVTELLAKAARQAKQEKESATPTLPTQAPREQRSDNKGQRSEISGQGPDLKPLPTASSSSSPTAGAAHSAKPVNPNDPTTMLTETPIDPLALAQSLFRAGDNAAALNAYRKLDKEDQKSEDRIVIQYMMACCLRKLGKMDEASVLYREAANSPGNDFLMECAQWYLRTMKDRRELEGQLVEMRQRRQAMKSRKP